MIRKFKPKDRVVYTRDKYSNCPGPRAKNVVAAPNGESYQYQVDKYWLVEEIRSDGQLVLRTRTGKVHVAAADDPRLRRASILERLFKASQFPSQEELGASSVGRSNSQMASM